MDKRKLISVSILPIMWFLYFIFELITGRVKSNLYIVFNILMCLIFGIVGYTIYKVCSTHINGFSKKTLWIIFSVLFILDQGSKIMIKIFFFEKRLYVLNDFLSFYPIINNKGSWLNARFGTSVSFSLLIILNILALILFLESYRYYKSLGFKDSWSDLCIVFIMAGCVCSLIDKIFYGGSLDFIGISDLFIADLKDIYINLAIFLFILTISFNDFLKDINSTLREDFESILNFFKFVISDIVKLFLRK